MDIEVKDIMKLIGTDMVARIVKILELNNKKATGSLIKSISYNLSEDKNGEFAIDLLAESYWIFVNNGRKPGKMPPPDAIYNWIKAKGIVPKPKVYKRVPRVKQTQESMLRSMAWAISFSIARRGIRGLYFLEKTISDIEKEWAGPLEKLWGQKWEEEYVKIFKKNFDATVK